MNIKSFIVKACAVTAFAVALPMVALDAQKDLVPEIPEGTNVVAYFDVVGIQKNKLVEKYKPEFLAKCEELSALAPDAPNFKEWEAKSKAALTKANLKEEDFKEFVIMGNMDQNGGVGMVYTSATPAQIKTLINEMLKDEKEKPVIADKTIGSIKGIEIKKAGADDSDDTVAIMQYKPGMLLVSSTKEVEKFTATPKVAADAAIVKLIPKVKSSLGWMAVVAPEKASNRSDEPVAISGVLIENGENAQIKGKVIFASNEVAAQNFTQVNTQFTMGMQMLAMQDANLSALVQKALVFKNKDKEIQIALTINAPLIDAVKAFVEKQMAGMGGMGPGGFDDDDATEVDIEELDIEEIE